MCPLAEPQAGFAQTTLASASLHVQLVAPSLWSKGLVFPCCTGEDSVSWATRRLALPLGVPNMFAGQSDASHVHAGGDNRLTCSALLRLGQLVANSGWWHVDGAPRQLIGNDYMREWLTPQFPELNSAYGFLTWLNQPTLRPQDTFKRPGLGWCDVRTHGAWVDAGGEPVGAPDSLAMGAGWLAKYVFILPETRTVVVSIGQTWTRSAACQPPQVWKRARIGVTGSQPHGTPLLWPFTFTRPRRGLTLFFPTKPLVFRFFALRIFGTMMKRMRHARCGGP